MIRINLHMHSTSSDGIFSPSELVGMLHKNKVAVASLTDHDTTEGVLPFLAACKKYAIKGVEGVEISSICGEEHLHILGYRFNLKDSGLNAVFERYRRMRNERNLEICERLRALNFAVTLEEAEVRARNNVVGRPHIAQVMREKGFVSTERDAFTRWLGRGKPAYVPRALLSAEDCIRAIRNAGGLPVWAHPLASLSDLARLEPLLDLLREMGLWGLECWFLSASTADTYRCLVEAGKRGLYQTAGTDFHGRPGHPGKIAGCVVEDDLLPWAWFCGGRTA